MKHIRTYEQFDADLDVLEGLNEGLIPVKFAQMYTRYRTKFKEAVKKFVEAMKQEADETKTAGSYVAKFLQGKELTKDEQEEIRMQFYDMLKMVGIGVPIAVIPGGSVLMPVLIKYAKKHNIKLTPTSF